MFGCSDRFLARPGAGSSWVGSRMERRGPVVVSSAGMSAVFRLLLMVAGRVGLRFVESSGVVDLYPAVGTAALRGSTVRTGAGAGEVGWLGCARR